MHAAAPIESLSSAYDCRPSPEDPVSSGGTSSSSPSPGSAIFLPRSLRAHSSCTRDQLAAAGAPPERRGPPARKRRAPGCLVHSTPRFRQLNIKAEIQNARSITRMTQPHRSCQCTTPAAIRHAGRSTERNMRLSSDILEPQVVVAVKLLLDSSQSESLWDDRKPLTPDCDSGGANRQTGCGQVLIVLKRQQVFQKNERGLCQWQPPRHRHRQGTWGGADVQGREGEKH